MKQSWRVNTTIGSSLRFMLYRVFFLWLRGSLRSTPWIFVIDGLTADFIEIAGKKWPVDVITYTLPRLQTMFSYLCNFFLFTPLSFFPLSLNKRVESHHHHHHPAGVLDEFSCEYNRAAMVWRPVLPCCVPFSLPVIYLFIFLFFTTSFWAIPHAR